MDLEWVRSICMALPGTTEEVLWGADLVFKVAGKMYAVAPLEPSFAVLSFKCSPEKFDELSEHPGCKPAAYLARAKWISLESLGALPAREITVLIRSSYELVTAKLPKGTRAALGY